MSTLIFPLRDDAGEIRPATLTELQESVYYAVYRDPASILRVLHGHRSDVTAAILAGNIKVPKALVDVRDPDYEVVLYASDDDVNFRLIYHKG